MRDLRERARRALRLSRGEDRSRSLDPPAAPPPIDAPPGSERDRARAALADVVGRVERGLLAYDALCEAFCRRSAARVLVEGRVHYGTPCCDLATASLARLRQAGLRPTLVLARIKRPLQPVKFQCGLELTLDGEAWYAGWSVTTARLAPGRFIEAGGRTHLLRAEADAAPLGAPFLASFGVRETRDLDRLIAGHALERHLRSYRSTTTRRAYEHARARAAEKARADAEGHLVGGAGVWAR